MISLEGLTKKRQKPRRVYQDSRLQFPPITVPPSPSRPTNSLVPKGNSKFKSYL